MLSSSIKNEVENQYGQSVRYPVECDALASDISKCTGRAISPSTIKRLWGFIDGSTSARSYTLDTIAEYCGHACFDDLVESFNPMAKKPHETTTEISTDQITVGHEITLKFGCTGSLKAALNDDRSFLVLKSSDCDLVEGDLFSCIKFEVGFPIFIHDWNRGHQDLGSLIIAKVNGIGSILVKPKGKN